MNYYEYADKLIGLSSNVRGFGFSFGTAAPETDERHFSDCLIRVHLTVYPEKSIEKSRKSHTTVKHFSHFELKDDGKTVFYSRKLFGFIKLIYSVRLDGSDVYVSVGRLYYRLIKIKLMNIHPIGCILSDIVSALLLINGYSMLYCAAVSLGDEDILLFGAPEAGKTLTAIRLCSERGAVFLSEDITITDGKKLWSVPFTATYGQHGGKGKIDFCDRKLLCSEGKRRYIFLLEKGEDGAACSGDTEEKLVLLNRYISHYASAPVCAALAYLTDCFPIEEMRRREEEIIGFLAENSDCRVVAHNEALSFCEDILNTIRTAENNTTEVS